jgi:N utilization substance protein B
MKSATDPRHQRRREIVKELFAQTFADQKISQATREILKDKEALDKTIQKAASAWPIDKLNKIDLSILRLAIYEINKGEVPSKVSVDEAVELAKEYGSESSPSFVNGVLGFVLKEKEKKDEK